MRIIPAFYASWGLCPMFLALVATVVPAGAQQTRDVVVQVHYSVAPLPATLQTFELAQQRATRLYARIGVPLVWTDGANVTRNAEAFHLVVEVLPDDLADRFFRNHRQVRKTVLGAAPRGTGRVYVFIDRVVRRGRKDEVLPYRVLGLVLAHEIGHFLLPGDGHSETGVMRRSLDYRSTELPTFTDAQAASIRTLLIPTASSPIGCCAPPRSPRAF